MRLSDVLGMCLVLGAVLTWCSLLFYTVQNKPADSPDLLLKRVEMIEIRIRMLEKCRFDPPINEAESKEITM